MEDRFDFAGARLKVRHDGDELSGQLAREIGYYRSAWEGTADCTLAIEKDAGEAGVPDRSVRSYFLDGQAVYTDGKRTYLSGPGRSHLISIDLEEKDVHVRFRENAPSLHKTVRWILKWLIIRSIEEKGMAYIHASAANHLGRTVIFSGDSHSGKSSSLLRLVSKGAKAISDDSVIYDGRRILPFTFNTSLDPDLEERFGIDGSFSIGDHVDHKAEYECADIVVFLRVWNHGVSEARPVGYSQALLNLIRSYQKELPFTIWSRWERGREANSRLVFEKYSALLEKARCFEFFAGNDEAEVRESLIRLVETG